MAGVKPLGLVEANRRAGIKAGVRAARKALEGQTDDSFIIVR